MSLWYFTPAPTFLWTYILASSYLTLFWDFKFLILSDNLKLLIFHANLTFVLFLTIALILLTMLTPRKIQRLTLSLELPPVSALPVVIHPSLTFSLALSTMIPSL